ncbi:hypothetical protein D3C75_1345300 [compost metagenome]
MEQRKFKDSYENEAKLNQAKDNYSRVIAGYTGPIFKVSATKPVHDIHNEVLEAILKIY